MEALLGLILGGIVTYWVINTLNRKQSKIVTKEQSVILLDRIKKVCKFITVEGDFSEIYHYEDTTNYLFKLLPSKKKALIIVKAKASVGFDLTKIKIEADNPNRIIRLSFCPDPEVLSIETDFEYYDLKEGMLNKFSADDLTTLSQKAKQHIEDKIPNSHIVELAKREAQECILLIEHLVQTIGWTLDYSLLPLPKSIEHQNKLN